MTEDETIYYKNKVPRDMKRLLPPLVAAALLLTGCDAVTNTVQQALAKGTLDAVVRCMESNANKTELLSSKYIREACVKEHSTQTNEDLSSDECAARNVLYEKTAVVQFLDCGCQNKSDRVITSVTTGVYINNIPGKTIPLLLRDTRENLFITPDQCLDFVTYASINEEDRELIPDDVPNCNSLDPGESEVCKSWRFLSFEVLQTNIR